MHWNCLNWKKRDVKKAVHTPQVLPSEEEESNETSLILSFSESCKAKQAYH